MFYKILKSIPKIGKFNNNKANTYILKNEFYKEIQ